MVMIVYETVYDLKYAMDQKRKSKASLHIGRQVDFFLGRGADTALGQSDRGNMSLLFHALHARCTRQNEQDMAQINFLKTIPCAAVMYLHTFLSLKYEYRLPYFTCTRRWRQHEGTCLSRA